MPYVGAAPEAEADDAAASVDEGEDGEVEEGDEDDADGTDVAESVVLLDARDPVVIG